jgi:hypothetical protein
LRIFLCSVFFEAREKANNPPPLLSTTSGFLALVAIGFALNHFRVEYYNSAMEGPSAETSPGWTIIRIQDLLEWPIFILAGLSGLLVLIQLVSKISAVFRSRKL